MPTNPNMVAIQTVTVGSGGASTIDFQNIPSTYTDLVLVTSLRSTGSVSQASCYVYLNNDTGSNYTYRILQGSGNAVGSSSATNVAVEFTQIPGANATASTFSNSSIYIPNYTGSANKSISADGVQENNQTVAYAQLVAGLWSNTNAITRVTLSQFSASNFAQYSTATLYGVTSAGYGAKATGGIIYQDADYYYHAFLSSGTFTPTQSLSADVLVIGGGGGGGTQYGGGGGAGGVCYQASRSLTATNYAITIGAGGAGGNGSASQRGANGSNSSFAAITANGGGGGGGWSAATSGNSGGSGGGGSAGATVPSTGSGGSSNQGNSDGATGYGSAGGAGYRNSNLAGGGGGGAGGVGGTVGSGTDGYGGAGGVGLSTWSSWGLATNTGQNSGGTYYYAGGGGGNGRATDTAGGAGGLGGGGKGAGPRATGTLAVNGTSNTGGGGGGGDDLTYTGATGGSGIVIVRYAR